MRDVERLLAKAQRATPLRCEVALRAAPRTTWHKGIKLVDAG